MNTQTAIDRYIASREKSPAGAFVLALVFGPLVALFGAPLGGSILLLATIALALSGLGALAAILGWLLALFVAPLGASDHNARVRAEAELMARGAR